MRILVTGGAGFIGSHLCDYLLQQGEEVVAVDNLVTGARENLAHLQGHTRFTFVEHDIILPLPVNGSFQQFDQIYHLACPTGVPNISKLGEEMLLTCTLGTRNVLEIARRHKAKVLFTSSSEVYGNPLVFPQTEEYTGNVASLGERSPYEEGKRVAESLMILYVRKYQIDAKIVRLFNTYGPRMKTDDTRVIPQFLPSALTNRPLLVQGDGNQTRTLCYIDDTLAGIVLTMNRGVSGGVYNVGCDQPIRIIDLAQLIIILTGSKSEIVFTNRPNHDHNGRQPSLTKIKSLGWEKKLDLVEGLQRTLASYLELHSPTGLTYNIGV